MHKIHMPYKRLFKITFLGENVNMSAICNCYIKIWCTILLNIDVKKLFFFVNLKSYFPEKQSNLVLAAFDLATIAKSVEIVIY